MKAIRFLAWCFVWLIVFFCVLWAFGALYYDFPIHGLGQWAAILFVVVLLAALIFIRGQSKKIAAIFAVFAVVLLWWFTLKPSNDGPWQPDVSETGWAEINGDEVIINNVRNCDYRTETDFTTHWEKRTVRLSQITGLDVAITYWGSPYMAHPIASFRFADALPICFSIETRKRIGQEYSAFRGLYRQYTLIYIVADERDSIRVRTNYRPGEDAYLYHVVGSPAEARERFLEYLNALNALHTHPLWYNAVTTNCTTNIRTQRPILKRIPWDWRILVNGKADTLLYERRLIATGGLPFAELKRRSHINDRARAADQDPNFSRLIRAALPQSD